VVLVSTAAHLRPCPQRQRHWPRQRRAQPPQHGVAGGTAAPASRRAGSACRAPRPKARTRRCRCGARWAPQTPQPPPARATGHRRRRQVQRAMPREALQAGRLTKQPLAHAAGRGDISSQGAVLGHGAAMASCKQSGGTASCNEVGSLQQNCTSCLLSMYGSA
jgi:hypothetical protein